MVVTAFFFIQQSPWQLKRNWGRWAKTTHCSYFVHCSPTVWRSSLHSCGFQSKLVYLDWDSVCVMRWTEKEENKQADGKVKREPGAKHRWRMSHVICTWSGRQGLGLSPVWATGQTTIMTQEGLHLWLSAGIYCGTMCVNDMKRNCDMTSYNQC